MRVSVLDLVTSPGATHQTMTDRSAYGDIIKLSDRLSH